MQAFPAHNPEFRFAYDPAEASQKLNVSFWSDPLVNKPRGTDRKVPNSVYRYPPNNVGFRGTVTSA